MKLKDFMRLTAYYGDEYLLYMRCYCREHETAVARYPIHQFGINSSGQLVFEVDYSMVEQPMSLEDFRINFEHLSPELNIFICNDWQRRCYDEDLKEVETFLEGENLCLGLLTSDDAWNKWAYKRAKAVEKYQL